MRATNSKTAERLLALLAFAWVIGASSAFAPIPPSIRSPSCNVQKLASKEPLVSFVLFSSPNEDDGISKDAAAPAKEVEKEDTTNVNIWSKLNSILDTPILDANDKKNQGAIVEALKRFVRDDAELASLTFSVVVVIGMAVAARGAMYVMNGY
jgi:hypothetical protein